MTNLSVRKRQSPNSSCFTPMFPVRTEEKLLLPILFQFFLSPPEGLLLALWAHSSISPGHLPLAPPVQTKSSVSYPVYVVAPMRM